MISSCLACQTDRLPVSERRVSVSIASIAIVVGVALAVLKAFVWSKGGFNAEVFG